MASQNYSKRYEGIIDDDDINVWPAPLKIAHQTINSIEEFKVCIDRCFLMLFFIRKTYLMSTFIVERILSFNLFNASFYITICKLFGTKMIIIPYNNNINLIGKIFSKLTEVL